DLKPANILLTADGIPKIADFGLAKKITDDPRLTESRAVVGSACYMAPEQAAGKAKDVGPGADVYALGVVLFGLLTGRPPFRTVWLRGGPPFGADTYELTVAQVLTQEPPRLTDLLPSLSTELEAICMKCLEKDPSRRYASAAALAEDLRRFHDGLPVSAAPL